MYKKTGYQLFLHKGAYFVLFSLFFFMQLQPKFIEAANNFVAVKIAPVQKSSYDNRTEATTAAKETYIKVSKRFDVNTQFTLLPALVICSPVSLFLPVGNLYLPAFINNIFLLRCLLRGPPFLLL